MAEGLWKQVLRGDLSPLDNDPRSSFKLPAVHLIIAAYQQKGRANTIPVSILSYRASQQIWLARSLLPTINELD